MGAKPIPEINWQNIRPPFDWWDFFRGAEHHPFRYQATSFDMRNAWWLIEASTLVYSNPEFVQKTFSRAGLSVVRFFDGQSTQCFVASNDDFIIVAFRGTETRMRSERPDYLDVALDLLIVVRIGLVPRESDGSVHGGFNQALDEVWWDREQEGRRVAGLKSYLDELSAQGSGPSGSPATALAQPLLHLRPIGMANPGDYTPSARPAWAILNSETASSQHTTALLTTTTSSRGCRPRCWDTGTSATGSSLTRMDISGGLHLLRATAKTLRQIPVGKSSSQLNRRNRHPRSAFQAGSCTTFLSFTARTYGTAISVPNDRLFLIRIQLRRQQATLFKKTVAILGPDIPIYPIGRRRTWT